MCIIGATLSLAWRMVETSDFHICIWDATHMQSHVHLRLCSWWSVICAALHLSCGHQLLQYTKVLVMSPDSLIRGSISSGWNYSVQVNIQSTSTTLSRCLDRWLLPASEALAFEWMYWGETMDITIWFVEGVISPQTTAAFFCAPNKRSFGISDPLRQTWATETAGHSEKVQVDLKQGLSL